MINIPNRLRVVHFPQTSCGESFIVEVKNEEEAFLICDTLARQHLWLLEHNIIPDYSNIIMVEMFENDIDSATKKPYGWMDYWNEEEGMGWEEIELKYFTNKIIKH